MVVNPQQRLCSGAPGARSSSPMPIRDTEDGQNLLRRDLSTARRRIDELESQIQRPSRYADSKKDSDHVDLKVLRNSPLIGLPSDHAQYRSWKLAVLLGLVSFDNSGLMKAFIMRAMEMRGDDQLALKFGETPLMQAMGMLGVKFMHDGCFSHPHFGPILETYSLECLDRQCNPSAPYILSIIAAHFDTSTGSAASERDLYSIKCHSRSDQHLQDFVSQVDYVMSQIKRSAIPSERNLFEFFYGEVQSCYSIKRHVDKIRDTIAELPAGDEDGLNRVKNFTAFRAKVVRELGHLQMQKVDVEAKEGIKNILLAITEKKA